MVTPSHGEVAPHLSSASLILIRLPLKLKALAGFPFCQGVLIVRCFSTISSTAKPSGRDGLKGWTGKFREYCMRQITVKVWASEQ